MSAQSQPSADARTHISRSPLSLTPLEAELLAAAKAVSKAEADFKTWAEAGVMRGLLPYSEADLRKASMDAFAALNAAIAKAEGRS